MGNHFGCGKAFSLIVQVLDEVYSMPSLLSKTILLTGLAVLLFLYLMDAVAKFRKHATGQTTVSRSVDRSNEALDLPDISFCPGYKSDVLKEVGWPMVYHEKNPDWAAYAEAFPRTKEAMQESWSNVTLGLEDVFSGVLMAREEPNLGEDGRPLQFVEAAYKWLDPSKLLETGGDECFRIKQYDTFSGRCFSVKSLCPRRQRMTVTLLFNLTLVSGSGMDLFLHHEGAYLGLNANNWPSPTVNMLELSPSIPFVDFALQKYIVPADLEAGGRNTGPEVAPTEEEYYDCVAKLAGRKADGMVKEQQEGNYTLVCRAPPSRLFLSLSSASDSIPRCDDALSLHRSGTALVPAFRVTYNPPEEDCPKPGHWTKYLVKRRQDRHTLPIDGRVLVSIYFDSTDVLVEEEYLLFDSSALLSALGGTMGMFLGWSALDLFQLAARMVDRKREK